jgi:2-polyprenyl-6-methoxyphenol hydroxylase-like FAD-dependent oxidoreductase
MSIKSDATTSVLIAGAGPVGLALACELGMRGVDCLLVEKRDGAITVPRMSAVSARNMEFCRRWGIADQVRGVWPADHALDCIYLESLRGQELARVRVPSYAQRDKSGFSPEGYCHCPQIFFDPILAARVKRLPNIDMRYNTAVEAFTQEADGVAVTLADAKTGTTQTVRARYLIGCDGPAGMVRAALGIALGGLGAIADSVNIFFRSAEFPKLHDKGWARFYRVIDETGCWGELIPIDGKEMWRLTVFQDPAAAQDPDTRLRKMMGGEFPYAIISAQPWERRDYVAERYREGRVFIAGDAAHQCSPTGGLGMHMGLEEAVNLAWKLAAVFEGWGGEHLLASYEAERRPIALRNVAMATQNFRSITGIPGWDKSASADNTADWRASMPKISPPEHLKVQYAYEQSPICIDDGTPPVEIRMDRYIASTRPGTRAPHAWLADGRSTLDLYGDGIVLVRLGEDAPDASALIEAAKSRRVPLREATMADPAIAALYERKLVLVRPDGHVAWRGDECPADASAVIDRVRGAEANAQTSEKRIGAMA